MTERPKEKNSEPPHEAIAALQHYQQADEAGVMVRVSRQALDEVLAWLATPKLQSATPAINTVPLLKRIREQRDRLADVLRWLDALGGLGLDKHARIREALDGIPTYEEQLRNIAKGIGMDYDELLCRLDGAAKREGQDG